jgi:hypothetical protein
MTTIRTIAGIIAASLAGYALVRAAKASGGRYPNPYPAAPSGCVRDGVGASGVKCDRCGRKLRSASTRLQCDGGIVAYCGPKCAADWIDRSKSDLPEPPFWQLDDAKCCTQPLDKWNAEEMRGKRTQADQRNAFAGEAMAQNWRPDRKGGPVSSEKVLKALGKEKRQLYTLCRQALCEGSAYIEALEPWGVPVNVYREKPNVWLFRAAQPWRNAPDLQVRYAKGVWKLQRNRRTISTAGDAETIAALAQSYLGDRAPKETAQAIAIDESPPWGWEGDPGPSPWDYDPGPAPDDDVPF